MRLRHLIWIVPVSAIGVALACAGPAPTSDRSVGAPRRDASATPQLLDCSDDSTELSPTATIGAIGGTLAFDGDSISIPPGAVLAPTLFQIVVPASPHMKVEIQAVGLSSFIFQKPVQITLDYGRCAAAAVPPGATLQAVYVDSTDNVLQQMGGTADTVQHQLTFSTGHLSGYAVAY